jgi:hypothetical protein
MDKNNRYVLYTVGALSQPHKPLFGIKDTRTEKVTEYCHNEPYIMRRIKRKNQWHDAVVWHTS